MRFEVKHALVDLEKKTPQYFLREIFSHGSLKLRETAQVELKEIDTKRGSARLLREILTIV